MWLPFGHWPLSHCFFVYWGEGWVNRFLELRPSIKSPSQSSKEGLTLPLIPEQGLSVSGSSHELWIQVQKLLPFSVDLRWVHLFLEGSLSSHLPATILH